MSTASSPERRRQACPVCGKQTQAAFKPFCGQGCRDRDLLNWLGEGYRVPGPPADPELAQNRSDGLDSEA